MPSSFSEYCVGYFGLEIYKGEVRDIPIRQFVTVYRLREIEGSDAARDASLGGPIAKSPVIQRVSMP
jgi:hypothetical protein